MNPIETYGLPGVLIIAVGALWVVLQKQIKDHKEEREVQDKLHRDERDDWKKTIERQFEDSNKGNKDNINVLSELSTLIKTLKK